MRKIHAAAPDRRSGIAQQRRDRHCRQAGDGPAAFEARHCDGVPVLCALPAYVGISQHGVFARASGRRQGRDQGTCRGGGENPSDGTSAGTAAGSPVWRSTPARRDRPRHRKEPRSVPVRRAAVESRRRASSRHARRNRQASQPARSHDDLCDPRSGRGDDTCRQDRGSQGRRGHAGRRADGSVQHAGE